MQVRCGLQHRVETLLGPPDGVAQLRRVADPLAESTEPAHLHVLAKPRAEVLIACGPCAAFEQPELLAQRQQHIGAVEQRRRQIDVLQQAHNRGPLAADEMGDGAERAGAGET